MRRGKKIAVVVSLIILILALIFVAYQLFLVRDISVVGDVNSGHVISLSGIEYEQSVFFIDKEAAIAAMDEDPWLKPIEITVNYPDKVVITVEPRVEIAYVEKDENLLAIDKECFLLRVISKQEVVSPLIYGLQMDKFEVGKQLGVDDKFVLDVVSSVLEQLNDSDFSVVNIDVSLAANIILHTSQGFVIELGDDTDLKSKFNLATYTMKELKKRGKNGGILDVSAVTRAYYREN